MSNNVLALAQQIAAEFENLPQNELYRQAGMKEPLVVWWIFVLGLNLIV
ncbi:MAG: hypothetical protein PUP93_16565 [Rhizonema sp. NSF051]|nr:hypothetical protein [Rhizonema sp. NSF051]